MSDRCQTPYRVCKNKGEIRTFFAKLGQRFLCWRCWGNVWSQRVPVTDGR